jgi:hypothetical protein
MMDTTAAAIANLKMAVATIFTDQEIQGTAAPTGMHHAEAVVSAPPLVFPIARCGIQTN